MIITNPSKEEYQKSWKQNKCSILQSYEWGEIKKPEWTPHRFIVDSYPITILVRKFPFLNKQFGYMPRVFATEIDKNLIDEILNYSQNIGLTHLTIDPFFESTSPNYDLLFKNNFEKSGHTIQPNQTNIVTLKDKETLSKSLKPKYRRNIKKSQRDGCIIKIFDSGDQPLDDFYSCMESIFARTSYVMHGKSYFKKVWNILSVEKNVKIYLAYKDNNVVGGYLVTFDNNYAYELYGGVTDAGRDVEAGYLLKWNAMLDALDSGKKFYDHWGVAPISNGEYQKNHELYHISKFKEGFGGSVIIYSPQLTVVFESLGYFLYKILIATNALLIGLKKLRK